MIPKTIESLKLPEGYELLFGDSCVIPASMDYRLFEPKIWYISSGIYTAAVVDLNKKEMVVKDNRYLSFFEEQGKPLGLTIRFEKVDPLSFINIHKTSRPRNVFE